MFGAQLCWQRVPRPWLQVSAAQAQTNANTLTNGLVSYWPMDVVTNGTTPDLSHGYDMILQKVVPGNFIASTRNGGVILERSARSAPAIP